MNKNALPMVITIVVVGVAVAAFYYWQQHQPKPEAAQVITPPPAAPKPEVHQVLESAPAATPLPQLAGSDSYMLDALAGLVGDKSLLQLFHTERIIRNIVATIDNLPRQRTSLRVMPVEKAAGKFITAGKEGALTISATNAARYSPYIKIAETIDAKKLVGLYVRLYPLFQQAYEELGFPQQYFNDRLIVVIDDLLETPNTAEPIKLVHHSVFYQYADPDLEALSFGQRTLLRIGSKNAATLKAKLLEIKQELVLHMHEKIVGSAG